VGLEFHSEFDPSEEAIRAVSAAVPANPFYTVEYCAAKRTLGLEPVILSLRDQGGAVTACIALLRQGRIRRTLEIDSLPAIRDEREFWGGLTRLCEARHVGNLLINSYSSAPVVIPPLPGECSRTSLREFVLPLGEDDLWKRVHRSHRWRINRARKRGLEVRRSRDPRDCDHHAAVMAASIARRAARGEVVPDGVSLRECTALVECGAGELFQVILAGRVLSSGLVLMAERGTYYQTSGTSPEGMERGASHLLIHEVAVHLKEQGIGAFNLGGVGPDDSVGLHEFKAGFGAEEVAVESAAFSSGNWLRKGIGGVARVLRVGMSRANRLVRPRSAAEAR
jgi:Acetyltransferase (GNAT) domain